MDRSTRNPERRRGAMARHAWMLATTLGLLISGAVSARAALRPLWSVESDLANSEFGHAVASADVNGDGYLDLIVGAPFASNGQTNEGRVFVYYGGPVGFTGMPTTPAWAGESNQAGALYGWAVASIGDVDDDGIDDIAVGAPLYDKTQADEGAVFVYAGSDTGLTTVPERVFYGGKSGALFGAAITGGLDIDDDFFDDMVVGSPQWTNGQTREGRVLIYRGAAGAISANPSWMVESNVAESRFGSSVSLADVNFDFKYDVIVGSPGYSGRWPEEGRVSLYMYQGGNVSTTPSFTCAGGRPYARLGTSVSGTGDFNGDGYDDVLVGAPGLAGSARESGGAFLFLGDSLGISGNVLDPSAAATWQFAGDQAESGFGSTVELLFDLDDDGFDDLAIGAPAYSTALTAAGRVTVYYGDYIQPGARFAPTPSHHENLDGTEAGALFGSAFMWTDVNDDLIDELLVGSPRHAANAAPAGRVHWFEVTTIATAVEPAAARGSGLAIQAIRPNPAHERIRVWFVLPIASAARLELIDVTGRRVMSHELGTLAPGLHDAPLADARELSPGIYLVRLSQGGSIATGKVAIVR